MKTVIFAGGVGTRLWPLSRKNSPKQFEKVIGERSTLQLSIERLMPDFKWQDIYLSTNSKYLSLVKKQIPNLLIENIIGEPETRDVGPAVALATVHLMKIAPSEPLVILWSDHLIKKMGLFKKILKTCENLISKHKNKLIFISQKPRFASQNLGWIEFGAPIIKHDNTNFREFKGFVYRPNLEDAKGFFKSGHFAWNTGYFVTTPSFLYSLYKKYNPEIFNYMATLMEINDKKEFTNKLNKIYKKFPKISFDNAILEKMDKDNALVISEDLGWSDIGAWEALKEALQETDDKNVVKGKVVVTDCEDSLVYNFTDQLLVTIDLKGYLVINTQDVVLVCHKNSVPKIKKLVEKLSESDNNHLV